MLSTYEPLFISMLSLIRPKLTSTLSRTFHILFLLSYVFFVLGFNSQKGCAGADYGYLLWAHLKPSSFSIPLNIFYYLICLQFGLFLRFWVHNSAFLRVKRSNLQQ